MGLLTDLGETISSRFFLVGLLTNLGDTISSRSFLMGLLIDLGDTILFLLVSGEMLAVECLGVETLSKEGFFTEGSCKISIHPFQTQSTEHRHGVSLKKTWSILYETN